MIDNLKNGNFYLENNCIVLTESFLKKRGFYCRNSCRHCPYEKDEMKTTYILKTSNDLTFEFEGKEIIHVEFGNDVYQIPVRDLDNMGLPLNVEINDEKYIINYFSKVKSV